MPFAGDPVAARGGDGAVLVGRSPGDQAARIAEDRARRLERDVGRDQRRAVADESVPADRAVEAGDLLDRAQVGPGLDLVAADRARQQHAEQPRLVQLAQKRFGDVLRALDLIGRRREGGTQGARACDRIGFGDDRQGSDSAHAQRSAKAWLELGAPGDVLSMAVVRPGDRANTASRLEGVP